MSRKAAKQDKPKGRGGKREGAGRKPKYGVPMVTRSITMREDTWERVVDGAEAQGVSQGRWIEEHLYPPHIWAMLNHPAGP